MRIIELLSYKDYKYSIESVEKDLKAGRITREQAKKSIDKITARYKSNDVNRDIVKAYGQQKNVYIK